jgi:hypothetical protein
MSQNQSIIVTFLTQTKRVFGLSLGQETHYIDRFSAAFLRYSMQTPG